MNALKVSLRARDLGEVVRVDTEFHAAGGAVTLTAVALLLLWVPGILGSLVFVHLMFPPQVLAMLGDFDLFVAVAVFLPVWVAIGFVLALLKRLVGVRVEADGAGLRMGWVHHSWDAFTSVVADNVEFAHSGAVRPAIVLVGPTCRALYMSDFETADRFAERLEFLRRREGGGRPEDVPAEMRGMLAASKETEQNT